LWEDDPEDVHMGPSLRERQDRMVTIKQKKKTQQQLADKVPKALASRTDKSYKKPSTKTG